MVDLAKFDFERPSSAMLRGAPETLNIQRADVTVHLAATSRRPSDPTTPDDARTCTIHVSSDFGGGYIEPGPDGTPKAGLAAQPANTGV